MMTSGRASVAVSLAALRVTPRQEATSWPLVRSVSRYEQPPGEKTVPAGAASRMLPPPVSVPVALVVKPIVQVAPLAPPAVVEVEKLTPPTAPAAVKMALV